jgi:ATP-dependent HslUV protease ATP-binding subunit HslU
MEKLLEDISFNASEMAGSTFTIDEQYVTNKLGEVVVNQDLSRYIL